MLPAFSEFRASEGPATDPSHLNYAQSNTITRVLLSPGREKAPDYGTPGGTVRHCLGSESAKFMFTSIQ